MPMTTCQDRRHCEHGDTIRARVASTSAAIAFRTTSLLALSLDCFALLAMTLVSLCKFRPRNRNRLRLRLFCASLIAFTTVPARAQDIPACARYEDALAYNSCLSKLGPRAGATRAADPSETTQPTVAPAGHGRVHSEINFARASNGRMIAVFDVGPAKKKKKTAPIEPTPTPPPI